MAEMDLLAVAEKDRAEDRAEDEGRDGTHGARREAENVAAQREVADTRRAAKRKAGVDEEGAEHAAANGAARLACADARARDPEHPAGLLARPDIAALPAVRAVLEHPELFKLARELLLDDAEVAAGAEVATVEYKWLRAVGRGGFTGVHTDRVYLGKGTERLLTIWIPLGATDPELGAMLVAPGSHRTRRFAAMQRSYGRGAVGADGVESGWLSAVRPRRKNKQKREKKGDCGAPADGAPSPRSRRGESGAEDSGALVTRPTLTQ